MAPSNRRRIVLYLGAALALGGLVYGGFIYESEADLGVLFTCAQIQLAVGADDKAQPQVEEILARDPGNYDGLMLMAYIHERREQWVDAEKIYRDLLARTEDADVKAELVIAIARMRHEQGDTSEALSVLAGCEAQSGPVRFKMHFLRAALLLSSGEREAAMEEYEAAAELYPDAPGLDELRSDLGLPSEKNSKTPEAPGERGKAVQVPSSRGR